MDVEDEILEEMQELERKIEQERTEKAHALAEKERALAENERLLKLLKQAGVDYSG